LRALTVLSSRVRLGRSPFELWELRAADDTSRVSRGLGTNPTRGSRRRERGGAAIWPMDGLRTRSTAGEIARRRGAVRRGRRR
jgi:hypothetical protein